MPLLHAQGNAEGIAGLSSNRATATSADLSTIE